MKTNREEKLEKALTKVKKELHRAQQTIYDIKKSREKYKRANKAMKLQINEAEKIKKN